MRTYVIAFEYVTGRHTAINIKKQYDLILNRFNITDKVFKVVADQAANMKKALEDVTESNTIVGGANEENLISLTKMLVERRRKLDQIEEKKQSQLVSNLNKSIEEINNQFSNVNNQPKINKYFNRDQILNDFDDMTEELSANSDDEINTLDDTGLDADEEDDYDREIDPNMLNFVFSSYLACAAHNGQLVLKDGLKLNEEYSRLIKKVSHDIVSKTKVSNLIAEEIRNLDKVLKSYVITRWNSILFMIRSVLKLTDKDFKTLRDKMNKATEKQRLIKKNFMLSDVERSMLTELEKLLALFEWMTNEFQSKLI
jgi:hypothetical protein